MLFLDRDGVVRYWDESAERVSIELTMMEVRDESGDLVGLGAIARDVTERFEREKARKERVEELEARVEEPPE